MKSSRAFRYQKLAHVLREQIMTGFLKPNDFLPTEHQLCEQYRLSRTSVRKALELLEGEGLIERRPGAGTRVSAQFVLPEDAARTFQILVPSPNFFVEHGGLDIFINEFRRLHPNVEISLLEAPTGADLAEHLRTHEKHGIKPDLVLTYDSLLRNLDNYEEFYDLEPLLSDGMPDIYPRLLEGLRFGSGRIAAPVTFSTVFLAYNPDLFESRQATKPYAGWTKDAFMEAARTISADTNGDGLIDQYGLMFTRGIGRWPVFAMQNGLMSSAISDYDDILQKTSAFLHDLLHRERIAVTFNVDSLRTHQHPFKNGKAAMTLTTTYELASWLDEPLDFEPQIAPLPFGPCSSTLLTTNALLIPKCSPKPELAQSFLRTALGLEAQTALCSETPFLSIVPAVNRTKVSTELLAFYNATEDAMSGNYHVHELFPDNETMEELIENMNFFWLAIESAPAFARRWKRLVPRMAVKQP